MTVNSTIQFYDFFERKDTEFMVIKKYKFSSRCIARRVWACTKENFDF